MLIYSQMRIESGRHNLPVAFPGDLTQHDAAFCLSMKAGQVYVWILRRHGTELFLTGALADPGWLTAQLDANPDALAYRVDVDTADATKGASGRLTKITHRIARELAVKGFDRDAADAIAAIRKATIDGAATHARVLRLADRGADLARGIAIATERGFVSFDHGTHSYLVARA